MGNGAHGGARQQGPRNYQAPQPSSGNGKGKHPWQMTYQQFRDYQVPSPLSDRSRHPGDVEELRGEGSLLSDYADDSYSLRDFLGHGYNTPQYDMSRLASAVRAGAPLTVYRATDAEREIWPGAYVTLSRQYAVDHGANNLGGAAHHVLSTTARPDELVAMNPNEFFYVPRDLQAWHAEQVGKAIAAGENVPANVRAEYEAYKGK